MSDVLRLPTGTIFAGDYRIVRPIEVGGMGAIYAVEQLSTSKERALKLMLPELVQEPSSRRRFEQESKIGAKIKSDHVVETIAAGVDPETQIPFLVMELLEGEDLATYLEKRPRLPPAEVREIFGQLCHALGEAHRQGIVHRDLKPENVFLARPRRRGAPFVVKVLDFGIARVLAEAQASSGQTQQSLGTPLWMAPEQAEPGRTIAPATDVWPLGLLAFRLLTGYLFWKTPYDSSATMLMLMAEVLMHPIPPASQRAAELEIEGRLPAGFDEWFARCVTRPLDDRFPDAAAAAGALDDVLAENEEPAPPPASPSWPGSRTDTLDVTSPAGQQLLAKAGLSPAPARVKLPAPPRPAAAARAITSATGVATGVVAVPRPPLASDPDAETGRRLAKPTLKMPAPSGAASMRSTTPAPLDDAPALQKAPGPPPPIILDQESQTSVRPLAPLSVFPPADFGAGVESPTASSPGFSPEATMALAGDGGDEDDGVPEEPTRRIDTSRLDLAQYLEAAQISPPASLPSSAVRSAVPSAVESSTAPRPALGAPNGEREEAGFDAGLTQRFPDSYEEAPSFAETTQPLPAAGPTIAEIEAAALAKAAARARAPERANAATLKSMPDIAPAPAARPSVAEGSEASAVPAAPPSAPLDPAAAKKPPVALFAAVGAGLLVVVGLVVLLVAGSKAPAPPGAPSASAVASPSAPVASADKPAPSASAAAEPVASVGAAPTAVVTAAEAASASAAPEASAAPAGSAAAGPKKKRCKRAGSVCFQASDCCERSCNKGTCRSNPIGL